MKTALLVIDVQVGIIDHFQSYNKDQVLANISDLLQIIAHHNRALNGFSSGKHTVIVKPASEIAFPML